MFKVLTAICQVETRKRQEPDKAVVVRGVQGVGNRKEDSFTFATYVRDADIFSKAKDADWEQSVLDWDEYQKEVTKRTGEIGRINPSLIRGYRGISSAGEKTNVLDAKTRERRKQ